MIIFYVETKIFFYKGDQYSLKNDQDRPALLNNIIITSDWMFLLTSVWLLFGPRNHLYDAGGFADARHSTKSDVVLEIIVTSVGSTVKVGPYNRSFLSIDVDP